MYYQTTITNTLNGQSLTDQHKSRRDAEKFVLEYCKTRKLALVPWGCRDPRYYAGTVTFGDRKLNSYTHIETKVLFATGA